MEPLVIFQKHSLPPFIDFPEFIYVLGLNSLAVAEVELLQLHIRAVKADICQNDESF